MASCFTHRRRVRMNELVAKSFADLASIATAQNIQVQSNISKWELLTQMLRSAYNSGAQVSVEGVLQINPLGFGMIKQATTEPPLPSHVYISPSQIATHNLQDGCTVTASVRPPDQDESYFAVKDLLTA